MLPTTQRGKELFDDDGYMFVDTCKRTVNQERMWTCINRTDCKARLHTFGGPGSEIVKRINDHTHAPNRQEVDRQTALTILRVEAAQTQRSTQEVVTRAIASIPLASRGFLPTASAMKKAVQYQRHQAEDAPPNVLRREDIVIPPEYMIYEKEPGVGMHNLVTGVIYSCIVIYVYILIMCRSGRRSADQNDYRNGLLAGRTEKLVYLYYNLRLLNFNY